MFILQFVFEIFYGGLKCVRTTLIEFKAQTLFHRKINKSQSLATVIIGCEARYK